MTLQEIEVKLTEVRDAIAEAGALLNSIETNPGLDPKVREAINNAILKAFDKRKALQAEAEKLKSEPKKEENGGNKPERDPNKLYASVGRGGTNDNADVMLIQKLINKRLGTRMGEDGKIGPETISYITGFQARIFQTWAVDSRVDPNGTTWEWLNSTKAIPGLPPQPVIKEEEKPVIDDNKKKEKEKTDDNKIKDVVKDNISNTIGTWVDKFLEKYANYSWDFETMQVKAYAKTFWGIAAASFSASFHGAMSAKLETKRTGATIVSKGTASASATLGMNAGLSVGISMFNVAGVNVGLSFSASANLTFSAGTSASLSLRDSSLVGTFSAPSGNLFGSLSLSATVDASAWAGYWKWDKGPWAAGKIAELCKFSASGNVIKIASWQANILKVTAPSFIAQIPASDFRPRAKQNGSYKVEMHPDVDRFFSTLASRIR